ncbi:phosphoadenosine phosphosulfate reductase family protein [Paenibacillus ottowii]|uniref:phosphoadenosine phosphosulfate reductase family protein n=1 Tax=Paenibacillus ottowii TaxID=2315729 RepID=UPI002DB8F8BB|nr:phosphoadenosine phosphosulfate reductase family protein [Paenibacillus sp. CMAA1739]
MIIIKFEIGTKENPRHICGVSGGKDSSALAIHIKNKYPEIFDKVEFFFTDTGAELPEVYECLDRLEKYLDKKILRLKADPTIAEKFKVVEQDDDSNPFEDLLKQYNGYLPAPNARWCTRTMKLQPLEKWIGSDHCVSYVGIRADEDREGYNSSKSKSKNIESRFLFQEDNLRLKDIYETLEMTVGLPEYYKWRTRSGCFFCFYQRRVEWAILSLIYPDWFKESAKYETEHADGRKFTWIKNKPLEYIENNAKDIIIRYIKKQYKKAENRCDFIHSPEEMIHMVQNNEIKKLLDSWDMKRLHDVDGENKEGCTICAI